MEGIGSLLGRWLRFLVAAAGGTRTKKPMEHGGGRHWSGSYIRRMGGFGLEKFIKCWLESHLPLLFQKLIVGSNVILDIVDDSDAPLHIRVNVQRNVQWCLERRNKFP
ncbi:hypothetical protein Hamer_G017179 [Homarus americanus]|uniref:Uncharacterized protein n=1 Tax=Homarus americanus TaxID=6706 RepID=A0A8J5MY39_HOMAM|nr:hypothetical protein Hamer_G017179 [Homarus americanus]